MGQGRHTLRSVSDPVYPRSARHASETTQCDCSVRPSDLSAMQDTRTPRQVLSQTCRSRAGHRLTSQLASAALESTTVCSLGADVRDV